MFEEHEIYIRRCIELAKESFERGDHPFGSVIVCDGKIIAEAGNEVSRGDVTGHAEILAMRQAQKVLKTSDLSNCIIYSNCEPCPMCSFMIRELKFHMVVFALSSPHLGGYSRWDILQDEGLEIFPRYYSKPPKVVSGVLESEVQDFFSSIGWDMKRA